MPQPLAPELFNYALSGRHDMGLDFSRGAWGSQGNLAKREDASLPSSGSGLKRARTDSWVAPGKFLMLFCGVYDIDALRSLADCALLENEDRSLTSDVAPPPPQKDRSLPRGRSTQPEIPRP